MRAHDFIVGEKLDVPGEVVVWNPDGEDCANPHVAISGESGSGKSHLVRKIIGYLAEQNKHVYVLDLHGDLGVEGVEENYIEFKARRSDNGINPFEFDATDTDNGGVGVNIASMVTMIKKAFLPNMGAKQESVLRQLLTDSYLVAGIKDDDESTWDRPLPSMESMLSLIDNLIEYYSQSAVNITQMLVRMDGLRRQLAELDHAGYFKQELLRAGITGVHLANAVTAMERSNEATDDAPSEEEEDENEAIDARVVATRDENIFFYDNFEKLTDVYGRISSLYGGTHAGKISSKISSIIKLHNDIEFFLAKYRGFCAFGQNEELFGVSLPKEINPKNYESKDVLKTLETLRIYISGITTSGIFSDRRPPVKDGLNRLDIHGLPEELKSFFVDAFITKIFRAMKMKGDYSRRANKSRGEKCSTYIVVDEGRTILPAGKDRDDHRQIMNKVMNEARKFGLGLIFVSQSPTHYSTGILSAFTKIVLKTQESEISKSMALLGVKDRNSYNRIAQKHTALVGVGSNFIPVGLENYRRPRAHSETKPTVGFKLVG